jgi:peroxiredoxin
MSVPTDKITGLLNRRFINNLLPIPARNDLDWGTLAPEIQSVDVRSDRQIKLSTYRHQQPVLIYFTRMFSETQYCPLCYPHTIELNRRYREFVDRGIEILLITSLDRQQSQIVSRDLNLQMPVISDPSCGRFRRYGTGQALGAPLPAQFGVNLAGRIFFKHFFSVLDYHAEVDALLRSFDESSSTANIVLS